MQTALHWAVRMKHVGMYTSLSFFSHLLDIVNLLIQYGTDVNIKGNEGTVLDLARKDSSMESQEIVSILTGGTYRTLADPLLEKKDTHREKGNKPPKGRVMVMCQTQ